MPFPWEGMSGAAIWVGDVIVGLVSKNHQTDGLSRLAATRIDSTFDAIEASEKAELCRLLEIPDGLPLPDVTPASRADSSISAYRSQIADIAPTALYGREQELGDITLFCAGDDSYEWWQAPPWAGKLALLSWYALNSPIGIDIVSFFITSRYAGQSDSEAFVESLVEQLAIMADEDPQVSLPLRARNGNLLRLLAKVAERSEKSGRRLLLIVDGLDEDKSKAAQMSQPSIASLLPRNPPPALRVLVASRSIADLPDDVPGDHPLRTVTVRQLDPSPHAQFIETAAKGELAQLLRGSDSQRLVLGLLTGSGGGLSLSDIEELSGLPPYELDELFEGPFGRTVATRATTTSSNKPADRIYLFAHETLRATAEQKFGAQLAAYRNRIHSWADRYRSLAWPAETPMYLLRGYQGMLTDSKDLLRLVDCATDRSRHDRMRETTGADFLGLSEISAAQALICGQEEPELSTCLLLAVDRDQLLHPHLDIPTELPALWAMLGLSGRAEALAKSIEDASQQQTALMAVARAMAAQGDYDRALGIALSFNSPGQRGSAVAGVIQAIAQRGDLELAGSLDAKSSNPVERDVVLARLVQVWLLAREYERAEAIAEEISKPPYRRAMMLRIAQTLAGEGEYDRADRILHRYPGVKNEEEALLALAKACAANGDMHRGRELAGSAESIARRRSGPVRRIRSLVAVSSAFEELGDAKRAIRLRREAETEARGLPASEKNLALREIAASLADRGDYVRAQSLALSISDPMGCACALVDIAEKASAVQDQNACTSALRQANSTLRKIKGANDRLTVIAGMAKAATSSGDYPYAMRLSRQLTRWAQRSYVQAIIAKQAALDDPELAADIARRIENKSEAGRALLKVVQTLISAGDQHGARALLAEAESLLRGTGQKQWHADSVAAIAGATSLLEEYEHAERLVLSISDGYRRGLALSDLATSVSRAGDSLKARRLLADAEKVFRAIGGRQLRGQACSGLAKVIANEGDHDWAEKVARGIESAPWKATALIGVAESLAASGNYVGAWKLEASISGRRWKSVAISAIVESSGRGLIGSDGPDELVEAESIARSLEEIGERAGALGRVARAYAAVGDYGRAKSICLEIPFNEQGATQRRIVAKMAQSGDIESASELAASIKIAHWRDWAWVEVAKAMAAAGRLGEAERVARAIADPGMKARGLVGIVEIASKAGFSAVAPREASTYKRMLADSLLLGNWMKVVRALALFDKESFIEIQQKIEECLLVN